MSEDIGDQGVDNEEIESEIDIDSALYAERKKDLYKEIDLIQSVMQRMSSTSFLIKGWTITLVAIIFSSRTQVDALPLVVIPIILFWILDAFFLHQGRLYRHLYEWVITNRMQTSEHLFSLNASRFKSEVGSHWKVMFSFTLLLFYGATLVLALLGIVLLFIFV
ncbi:hypothetical protein [Candidatus Albibeggiatoa sp. nov. NOAA]|uniref:hypothetical protein n=1 Tax=Candidatus Albibeggiatoa sp. nov. NOAA TaxID=3162724 RepID=UPI0032F1073E|nr:hypothetical protein [Thiotrichaceae bacterium]